MRTSLFLFCLILLAVPVHATTLPSIKGTHLLAVRHDSETKTIWTASNTKRQTVIHRYDQNGKRLDSWTGPLSTNVDLLRSYVILHSTKQFLIYDERGTKQFTLQRSNSAARFSVTNDGKLQLSDGIFRYTFTTAGKVTAKQLLSFNCKATRTIKDVTLSCLQPKKWTVTLPATQTADVTTSEWLDANVIALHMKAANGKAVQTRFFTATGKLLRQFTSRSHVTLGHYFIMANGQNGQAYDVKTGAILPLTVKKTIAHVSGRDRLLTVTTPSVPLHYWLANGRFTLLHSGELVDFVPLRNGSFVLVTRNEAIFFDENGRKWTTITENFATHQRSFTTENGVLLLAQSGHARFFNNDGTLVYNEKWPTLPLPITTHMLTTNGQQLELRQLETGERSISVSMPNNMYQLETYHFHEQQQFGLLVYTNPKTKAFLIQILLKS